MQTPNAYESACMHEVLGETLRPGGFSLTDTAVSLCKLCPESDVLDIGCGRGATVNYLYEKYRISAAGIDPSEKLIAEAKSRGGSGSFFTGRGESLPFESGSFDCVFTECTLSLMDADLAIDEAYRMLRPRGRFVISDVYAKNPEAAAQLRDFSVNSCMRGMHDLERLKSRLEGVGFTLSYFEECSQLLKELVVKIGFSYGSMCNFWNAASDLCINGTDFEQALKKCKPGYFMLIAQKGGTSDE